VARVSERPAPRREETTQPRRLRRASWFASTRRDAGRLAHHDAAGKCPVQRRRRLADPLRGKAEARAPGLAAVSRGRNIAARRHGVSRLVAKHRTCAGGDRLYPHGDEIAPDDANYDGSYGHVDSAFGPDEVGSHESSRSPFGVDDMAGNAFEFTTSSERRNDLALRSGAYPFKSATSRSTNREAVPATFRDVTTGIRVCASLEGKP
jgi:hypothetical protein